MNHKTLAPLILLVAAIVVAIVFYQINQPSQSDIIVDQVSPPPSPQLLAPTPESRVVTQSSAPANVPSVQSSPAAESLRLLQQEKQRLAALHQNMQSLLNQQAQTVRQSELSLPIRIAQDNLQMQNLKSRLEQDHLAEVDVDLENSSALADRKSSTEAERERLDENVNTLDQDLRSTQNEILNWQTSAYYLPEYDSQLQALQNQLVQETQLLENLRAQRQNLSNGLVQESRASSAAVSVSKAALQNEESEILNRISQLRSDIARLQIGRNQTKLNLTSLQEEIRQAQSNIGQQEIKVRNLEASISGNSVQR